MKIAVFSDIHSNAYNLSRVLESIQNNGVDRIIHLGDSISRGNNHKECVDILKENSIECISGNCELYYSMGVEIDKDVLLQKEHYDEIHKCLTKDNDTYIASMPMERVIEIEGIKLYFSHFLFEDRTKKYPYFSISSMTSKAYKNEIDRLLKEYDLLVFGHIHRGSYDGNVVYVPAAGFDDPGYVIITIEDSIQVEFIKL